MRAIRRRIVLAALLVAALGSLAPAAPALDAVGPVRLEVRTRLTGLAAPTNREERRRADALKRAAKVLDVTNLDQSLAAELKAARRGYAALRAAFRHELDGTDTSPEANLDELFAEARQVLLGQVTAERDSLEAAFECGGVTRGARAAGAALARVSRTLERSTAQTDVGKSLKALAPASSGLRVADRLIYAALGGTTVYAEVDGAPWQAKTRQAAFVRDEPAGTLFYLLVSREVRGELERLQLQIADFNGVGTYPASATFTSEPLRIITRSSDTTGTITVTFYDPTCRTITGEFALDAIDRQNPDVDRHVILANGRFSAAVRLE